LSKEEEEEEEEEEEDEDEDEEEVRPWCGRWAGYTNKVDLLDITWSDRACVLQPAFFVRTPWTCQP
jgi:hypothetical protein